MQKRILILGSGGMAGHVVTLKLRELSSQFLVTDISRRDNVIKPKILLDVTKFDELKKVIQEYKPDVIINCVGILNQTAEDNPDIAILVNSYLPHFLEQLTKNTHAKIIHISTDCVFSGNKGQYHENAFKNGKGYYAQTKALGEIINDKDLTIRTSIIGPELNSNGIGLFNWFAKQETTVNGYVNVFWTGVTTIELANAIINAININTSGLYHLVNNEKISKFSLLELFLHHFSKSKLIQIVPYENYKSDKSLVNTRTDGNFIIPPYDKMVNEMKSWIEINRELYPQYQDIL